MVIGAEASRHSMAVVLSVAGHALLLSLLASGAFVRLSVVPSSLGPVILTLVEPGVRTEGPGERSPRLRIAEGRPKPLAAVRRPPPSPARPAVAPPAKPTAALPPPPAARLDEPASKPVARPAPKQKAEPRPVLVPEASPEPRPAPAPKARPKPPAAKTRAEAVAAAPKLPPSPSGSSPAGGTEVASLPPGAASGLPGGVDARSTAPSWAPEARVRYEELLFAWMNRHKQYPMLARRRGLEGSGSIRVRIDRRGRVVDRSIQNSTGERTLDRAALDMVRRASPFPAVPDEYAGEGFEFVAPIQYRLR